MDIALEEDGLPLRHRIFILDIDPLLKISGPIGGYMRRYTRTEFIALKLVQHSH